MEFTGGREWPKASPELMSGRNRELFKDARPSLSAGQSTQQWKETTTTSRLQEKRLDIFSRRATRTLNTLNP
jgi:hypothetical protein